MMDIGSNMGSVNTVLQSIFGTGTWAFVGVAIFFVKKATILIQDVEAVSKEIEEVKKDYVKKDVFDIKLANIESRLERLEDNTWPNPRK